MNRPIVFGLILFLLLSVSVCSQEVSQKASFKMVPKVKKIKNKFVVSFETNNFTNVEIAILNEKDVIVRHLAAGLLGKNAPKPFLSNSLLQNITWDGLDDKRKKPKGVSFSFRVRLGAQLQLEKYVGWHGHAMHNEQIIVGLQVNLKGQLYVLFSEETWGRSELRVFESDGKYAKTLMPYPKGLPLERSKGIHQLNSKGKKIPFVYNGHSGALLPLTSGFKRQDIGLDSKGNLLLTSAVGSLSNHGPMRHLLAMDPKGGSPESMGFVGPQLYKVRGFLGGSGESHEPMFDGLAVSPDDQYIYVTMRSNSWSLKDKLPHGVYRLKWTDKKLEKLFIGGQKKGAGDRLLNDPHGLAVDKQGDLFVCDRGNNRIVKYSSKGDFLGSFDVVSPIQIRIHQKTKAIYVLSRMPGKAHKRPKSFIAKFSPWVKGTLPKESSRVVSKIRPFNLMALDDRSEKTKLWIAQYGGWQVPDILFSIEDKRNGLLKGQNVLGQEGVGFPMFISVDGKNQKCYVTSFRNQVRCLDLMTNKVVEKIRKTNEIVVDEEGNRYSMHGWKLLMRKANTKGSGVAFFNGKKDLGPWKLPGKEKDGSVVFARSKGPSVGDRGHCFAPNGDMYVIKMAHYGAGRVDIHAPDGTLKREGVITNLTWGSSGISVDGSGNIYIGINVRPLMGTDFYSSDLKGQISTDKWHTWSKTRTGPIKYPYFNTYLFHWGTIVKFSPKGGRFWEWKKGKEPTNIPQKAKRFRSGYLSNFIAIEGAEWVEGNCGPIPTTGENWGDPSCSCWNSRLTVDPYGRIYSPDVFHFGISVLDTNSNPLQQVGEYGNVDDVSKMKGTPTFSWPAYLSWAKEKVYVADSGNNRIAILSYQYQLEIKCKIQK